MANNIALAKKYTALLDEVYKAGALTQDSESDSSLVQAGANTNEIIVPKISMDGLGDYSRSSGYVTGDVDLSWETRAFNFERGRMFTVDDMDDEESQRVAFGKLAGEFIRVKVIPELDAFRFAMYCSKGTKVGVDITASNVIAQLRLASDTMDNAEVPIENRFLYVSPTVKGFIDDLDTTKSREVMAQFAKVIKVPQTRFYSAIDQYDGTTSGETAGGYIKSATAKDIQFQVIHKQAVLQFTKHATPKIITPEMNQDADAWKYGYRNYGLTDAYDNKVAGIYTCYKA